LEQTTTPELREIAKRYGVPFARKDSRMRLMRRIVFKIHAKNLEAGARPPAASKNRPATPNIKIEDPGNYERWANIIIGRSRNKRWL
jgi:hypothetical protein